MREPTAWIKVGAQVQRRPCGRICRVVRVERGKRALIKDISSAHWVTFKTLTKRWQPVQAPTFVAHVS